MIRVGRTASNTLWNIAGQVAPGLVALVAIPLLIHGLGKERFGVLSLAWAAIGYLSLFDLGIGRAVTRFAADALGEGDQDRFVGIVWTGWVVLAATGLILGLMAMVVAPFLSTHLLKFSSPRMTAEGATAFLVMSTAIPAVVATAGIRGVLEASGHFAASNLIRIPLGILAFIGPVLLLPFTRDLGWQVGAVAFSRWLGVVAFAVICLRIHPALRARPHFVRRLFGPMLNFGSWITVSSVISPLMATMDRFLVGGLLSVSAVAVYEPPFTLASRLLIVPAALATVAFPRFAAIHGRDKSGSENLYRRSVSSISIVLVPCIAVGILLAPEILRLWVGADMAITGAPVLRCLLAGVLLNAVAHVPYAHIQGAGAADVTAKAHLLELPVYVGLVALLAKPFGLAGIALAWTGRVALDYAILDWAARSRGAPSSRAVLGLAGLAVLVAVACSFVDSLAVRGAASLLYCLGGAALAWQLWGREMVIRVPAPVPPMDA